MIGNLMRVVAPMSAAALAAGSAHARSDRALLLSPDDFDAIEDASQTLRVGAVEGVIENVDTKGTVLQLSKSRRVLRRLSGRWAPWAKPGKNFPWRDIHR
ncbi:MAG: hypothetical protein AAF484_14860 [Pseudomonadota bacterium]